MREKSDGALLRFANSKLPLPLSAGTKMSRVRRLSLRGIRNFGEEDEETEIRFSRPLTLILGSNGTGKTTIIEALKFATCGEFPPGSDRGKCFVHDPALTICSSVRGVVKAEICDTAGNIFTICRTIEYLKVGTTMRFKTLDSTLSRTDKITKKTVSISNRCANVDTELTLAMGISKPILDYVIFCHQEDLNWPFSDGKKLKEKFDEIFDSARYNKALENIVKNVKELKKKAFLLKGQERISAQFVKELEDKEKKLEDYKRRLQNVRLKIDEIGQDLEPVHQKLTEMEKLELDYKDLVSKAERRKAEYEMSKLQCERLQENIPELFEGSLEELEEEFRSYDTNLVKKTDEIKELDAELKDLIEEESTVSKLLADERESNGSLKQQIKEQERKIYLRNTFLNKALSVCNLSQVGSDVSEIEVAALTKRVNDKLRELNDKIEESRFARQKEEKEMQKKVDILRSEYLTVDSQKNVKENELIETRRELDQVKAEISQIGAAANKLNSIESKLEEVKRKIQKLNEAMDVELAKKEILDKTKSRNEMETRLNRIDEEIASLLKQSSLQAELELNKSTLFSKEQELQKLKEKHGEKLRELLNTTGLPESKLKTKLDAVQKQLMDEIKQIDQETQTAERQSTTLETTIMHMNYELQKKRREIESDKLKIASICYYKNFDEVLLMQSRKVKDLQDRRGMYAHQGTAYKEYMRQLKETNPCCPLCHRGFHEQEAVVALLKEMETEMKTHPNRLKECEKELKIQQEKYDKMLQLKPVVDNITQFEESESEAMKNKIEKSENKLMHSQTYVIELKEKKCKPESKLAMCNDIMSDVMLWDNYVDELSKLKRIINNIQARMVDAGILTNRSLEKAQAEREELKASLKRLSNEIESLQSKINMYNENMNNAREKQNTLHAEKLNIESSMQQLKQLKDRKEALFLNEISIGSVLDTLRQKVAKAESELNAAVEKLETKKKENWDKLETDKKSSVDASRHLAELKQAQTEVNLSMDCKIPEAVKRSEAKIRDYQESISQLLGKKNNKESRISKLKETVNRQEIRKRELRDNIELLRNQETTKKLEDEYLKMKVKLSKINYTRIIEERTKLINREQVLLRQKNTVKGNEEELERVVKECTEELRKDVYRLARKKHKSKCIERTVVEETILNLNAYAKVLDKAMIEYHEERMTSVNRIIKEMWRIVYTGTDTTSIEIRTNATEGIGSARRTYNYKIVQTKHAREIDMRGRCSAGQKVLASIIIRLALAETFCKSCGVLALDEPTTNLDQENANSLATALANVVKLRSRYQKNFQLIIITHDEKFLLKLAELNNNKGFYELYRKFNGYTTARRCFVQSQDYISSALIKNEESSDEDIPPQNKKRSNESGHGEQTTKKRYVLQL